MLRNIPIAHDEDAVAATEDIEGIGDVAKRIDPGNKKEKHRMLFTRMGRSDGGRRLSRVGLRAEKMPNPGWQYWVKHSMI